jgi:hypothetical protein
LLFGRFFNLHVVKLFGVKDFATLQALDIFGVLVPGDDSYPGMFAGGCHRFIVGLIFQVLFPQIVAAFAAFSSVIFVNRIPLVMRGMPRGPVGFSSPA